MLSITPAAIATATSTATAVPSSPTPTATSLPPTVTLTVTRTATARPAVPATPTPPRPVPLPTPLPTTAPPASAAPATPPALPVGPAPAAEEQVILLDQGQYYTLWWILQPGQRITHALDVRGVDGVLTVYLTGPDGTRRADAGRVSGAATVAVTAATAGPYTLWLDDRARKSPLGLKEVRVTTIVQ